MGRKRLLDTSDLISVGDIFTTNHLYEGDYNGPLRLVEISEDVVINGQKTYLLEKSDGSRSYFGRAWVTKVKKALKGGVMELEVQKKIKVNAKKLHIHIKVRDQFSAVPYDDQGEELCDHNDIYVPSFMSGKHYGDYLDLEIDIDSGMIINWKIPTAIEVENFINQGSED